MSTQLHRTPLYPVYEQYGARLVDFAGWEMPVQFSGIVQEHAAVRTKAGLFDVSHMGELLVSGSDALDWLQSLTTNDLSRLADGRAQYTFLCYPDGGTVDDLLVYRLASDRYMLVVNASNRSKVLEWLDKHRTGAVSVEDISDETALLALQGPEAERILRQLTEVDLSGMRPFSFVKDANVGGSRLLLSRSGYTGEDGFELYAPAADAISLWEQLFQAGGKYGLLPAGLGARDTLRFEAGLPLYGQELGPDVSPIEAGLGFAVRPDKGEFIGRSVLAAQKQAGPPRRTVGLEMLERGIPRTGYEVYAEGKKIGVVTSGTKSPTLGKAIGLARIESDFAAPGSELTVHIRGKQVQAKVVPTPFYKRA